MIRDAGAYGRLLTGPELPDPVWATPAQAEVHGVLNDCAVEFARRCRTAPNPKFPRDAARTEVLQYGRGLGEDEAAAFLRALRAGLVAVDADGHFLVPGARACSPNLHLVGRNEDHVALHGEVLIHVGVYAELVLDHGWAPERLVFDPFMDDAALDLWGYAEPPPAPEAWREGRIVFASEVKARTTGRDRLSELRTSFRQLEADPSLPRRLNHQRKWDELRTIIAKHGPVELLLAADGARWWFIVEQAGAGLRLSEAPEPR